MYTPPHILRISAIQYKIGYTPYEWMIYGGTGNRNSIK
jgi:hypothetical protein